MPHNGQLQRRQAAGRLGNIWVQQRGRGDDDQHRAGLGLACGSWRQEQAEVTVGDPAGLQRLAERVRAELVSAHIPPSSPMLVGAGYWLDEEP
jgi:hypothetical protein